ncbi:hypothetical protein CNMCM8689_006013 [Aspergillus fumigatus]|nr:hypothetical protein CNMCM8689_006013 [Aspergillus fumigatus]
MHPHPPPTSARRHTDPAADIGRARAPCRSERWAARAEGTGGQAGAGFEGRPALRARDGASDQVPLRPKQRANLRGPLCMGARANARTTPYRMGPPPARSGPGNVCTHDHGPVEVGGSMWKARAASPLVACELCAGHFFPARQAASLRGFYSRAAGAQRPWSGRPGCRRGSERPAMGAPVTPETCDGRPSRGRFVLCLKTPGSPHRWDDRSPGAVWSPAPMEFPGGAAPREPPFVGVSAGSGPPTRGPYAAARQRPRGRSDGITCVRTGSEGLQWGQLDGRRRSPGAPGAVGAAGRRMSPLLDSPTYTPPLRGLVGPARSAPFARWSAGAGAHQGDYRLKPMEVRGNNRSVMPLDVLGRTRATLTGPASTSPWPRGLGNLVKPCRAGDRALQLLLFNEECLVGTSHQLVPITSLPFVHTARRYYRLNGSVRPSDWLRGVGNDSPEPESEPAEGSLPSEGPLGPTSHPCLSYLVASAGPPFRRPPGRPCAPGPAPAEDPNMNAVLKNSVNHRVFERTLRPLVFRGACLSERHCCPQARLVCWAPVPLSRGTGPKGSGGTASGPRAYGALSPAL